MSIKKLYHDSIVAVLSQKSYQEQDVRVYVDKILCGLWLWEDQSQTHIHFDLHELVDILGSSDSLLEYMDDCVVFNTSWKFINPTRLKMFLPNSPARFKLP